MIKKTISTEKKIDLDFSKKSGDNPSSKDSNKKELFKMLQNVENRNILINRNGQTMIRKASVVNSISSRNNSLSNKSGGRSPVKIMKLVGPESTVPDTEKKHYKLRNSIDRDSQIDPLKDSGLNLRKSEGVDLNRTMPNLKEALENEARKIDDRLMRTTTSMNSDHDDVYSSKFSIP